MNKTPEQKKVTQEIYSMLRKAYPDFYGSIEFNMHPGKKDVSIKITETIIAES